VCVRKGGRENENEKKRNRERKMKKEMRDRDKDREMEKENLNAECLREGDSSVFGAALCCSMLQCVAVCCSVGERRRKRI